MARTCCLAGLVFAWQRCVTRGIGPRDGWSARNPWCRRGCHIMRHGAVGTRLAAHRQRRMRTAHLHRHGGANCHRTKPRTLPRRHHRDGASARSDRRNGVRSGPRAATVAGLLGAALGRELLRNAILAPSSHSTQVWKFAIDGPGQVITVLPDTARRCPVVDSDDRRVHVLLVAPPRTWSRQRWRTVCAVSPGSTRALAQCV
jgi:hypothetical protein